MFLLRLQTFFYFCHVFTFFNVFYFYLNVFYIYAFYHPSGVEGCVDLGIAVKVHSLCPRLYNIVCIAAAVATNTTVRCVIRTFTPQLDALTTRPLRPAAGGSRVFHVGAAGGTALSFGQGDTHYLSFKLLSMYSKCK